MRCVGIATSLLVLATSSAWAAEPLIATQDRATVVKLTKDAGNIIIGNPAYFDITIEDPRTLILFGKQPGQTNMIIWDDQRREVMNTTVLVLPDKSATSVRIYSSARGAQGALETTYACAGGNCVRTSVGTAPGALSPIGPEEDGGEGGGGAPGGGGGGTGGGGGGAAPGDN